MPRSPQAPRDAHSEPAVGGHAAALAVWVVGALASVFGYRLVSVWEEDRAVRSLQGEARGVAEHLRRELARQIEVVQSVASLYDSSTEVEPDEFSRFAGGGLGRHEPLEVLTWILHVPRADLAEHLADASARERGVELHDRGPDGARAPLAERGEHAPLWYVEPPAHADLLGVDAASIPVIRPLLQVARDDGLPHLTRTRDFYPGAGMQLALLLAVYRHDRVESEPTMVAERRERLHGYVGALLSVQSLVRQALVASGEAIFEILEVTGADQEVLYVDAAWEDAGGTWLAQEEIDVCDRKMVVRAHPSREAELIAGTWRPWGVLAGGLIVASALALTVASSTSRRRIQELVHRRTQQIEQANRSLVEEIVEHVELSKAHTQLEKQLRQVIDLVPHMIYAKDANGRYLLANEAVASAYGTTVNALTQLGPMFAHALGGDPSAMDAADRRVIEQGRPLEVEAEGFVDAAGGRRRLRTLRIPFRVSGDDQAAVLCVAIDVTSVTPSYLRLAEVLDALVAGTATVDLLEKVALGLEGALPGWKVAVLAVEDERLRLLSAPSLPAPLAAALDGLVVGPAEGAVGTALTSGERVTIEDVAKHPHTRSTRSPVREADLSSAWAEPLMGPQHAVGVVALYGAEPRLPDEHELERARVWIAVATLILSGARVRGSRG